MNYTKHARKSLTLQHPIKQQIMMKKILLAILILFLTQAETTAQTLPKMWRKAKNQELLQPKDALRTIDTIIYI